MNEKERTQPLMQLKQGEPQAFGAAADDGEDDVIGKTFSMTFGCTPLAKKEQEAGRGGKEKRKGCKTWEHKGKGDLFQKPLEGPIRSATA